VKTIPGNVTRSHLRDHALRRLLPSAGLAPSRSLVARRRCGETNSPKVDALVTDIAMPAMNGVELVQRARRHPSHASLPAIAITAFPEQSDATFDALLVKPIRLDRLCSAVRAAVDARRT
jgi:CheY-like chemotaxis protein